MRAKPGRMALALTLKTDEAAQYAGQKQPQKNLCVRYVWQFPLLLRLPKAS